MMRTIRKKLKIILILMVAFFIISFFYGFGKYNSNKKSNRNAYIAEVNGTTISYDQWQKTFQNAVSRYDNETLSNMDQSTINSFKNNVLKQMINSELLYQQAKKDNLRITKDEINLEISKIKENFPSDEEFNNVLKTNNITLNQLKEDIKRNLLVNKVLDETKNKINISDDELKEYFDKNQEMFFEQEKVHARHILVETEEEAKTIVQQLNEGIVDFSELAKEKSIGPSAEKGGDLGFFGRGQMVKEFEDVAFALQLGEISGAVKTQFGYHIIKCEEKEEEHQPTFEESKERISNLLRQQKENEAITELIKTLNDNANIVINYDFEAEGSDSSSEKSQTTKPTDDKTVEVENNTDTANGSTSE